MPDPAKAIVSSPTIRDDHPSKEDFAVVAALKYPVEVEPGVSFLANGTETVTGAVAVPVLAANHRRKTGIIQNVGSINVRVGVKGVTPTTGVRLVPDGVMILDEPFVSKQEIWAVSESAGAGLVFTTEAV